MALIPELEGLAIVPTWKVRQDRLPPGVIMGQEGKLSTPTEVYHMAEQLHAVLNSVMAESFKILKSYDDRLSDQAEEIRAQEQKLAHLHGEIKAAESERGTDSGDTASPDGANADS